MNQRLQKLKKQLVAENLDAVFVSSIYNIIYLTNFTGFSPEERDAFLFITPNKQYLFTHSIFTEAAKHYISEFTLIPMTRENPTSQSLAEIIKEQSLEKIGYEAFNIKVGEFARLTKTIKKQLFIPTSIVENLRMIKTPDEIANIQAACTVGDQAFSQILSKIVPGITEKQLANEIDYLIKYSNADVSFPTISAFGSNAAHPHHVPSGKKLEKNNLVLFDFGTKVTGYCSDMSRTIVFGKATKKQKHVYQTVLDAQQAAIDWLDAHLNKSPNVSDIDSVARKYILSKGYPDIPHSLGHGIGIEVHESPSLSPNVPDKLTEGMVFSIEPGIYLPNEIGVRIEDLFTIQGNKLTQLTQSSRDLLAL